jgi:hypothetical protein
MFTKPAQFLGGFCGRKLSHFSFLFSANMVVNTTPNTARGEAHITIAGQAHPIRFGMNVLRDWTKLTGKKPTEFGALLSDDYTEALTSLLSCAVRRFVPDQQAFTQDDAGDLIDVMTKEEAESIGEAITEAVTTGDPLMAALSKQVAAKNKALRETPQSENGTDSSTSDSAS